MSQSTGNEPLNTRELISGSPSYNTQMLYFTCSSLSADDRYIYLISDRTGVPNVFRHDLTTGEELQVSDNTHGTLKSYVYFDCTPDYGLGKASVCLDCERNVIYYIQDHKICAVDCKIKAIQGPTADVLGADHLNTNTHTEVPTGSAFQIRVLNTIPEGRMTAFTHVSADGTRLCVPMTDGRCLDYDPDTEGSGLDKRPVYDIDGRVQKEHLSSYLCVYDTASGELLYEKQVPDCWITHVQFNPVNHEQILYNHEWASFDCGIRRIWLYDHSTDVISRVRTEGTEHNGHTRSREDWVCHEMWSDDGNYVIYHGAYNAGPAFVGKVDMNTRDYWEIALPEDYNAYGHFTMDHFGHLVCDGYFKFPGEIKAVFENSTDNGPDPHKKDGAYISIQSVNWEKGSMTWQPLCRHESDWLGQDAHPHPIYSHKGDYIYFSSRNNRTVEVYRVSCQKPV